MKIVVIGCNGMLGSDLLKACEAAGFLAHGLDLPRLDVRDFDSVRDAMPQADWAVNCAAYTQVDNAETNRQKAFAVNAEGARHVARACLLRGIKLLHISTDYVFDGHKPHPYTETDIPNPLGVYGASKLAGEKAVRAEGGRYLILRTQSLFGVHGPNFVRAIAQKALNSGDAIHVVEDQVSCPTYTVHLAEAIVRLLRLDKQGVVHVAASDGCSWLDFARAIVERVKPGARVVPIKSAELNRPAPRPDYSVLDCALYRQWTGQRMPTWSEGLDAYLGEEVFT